MSDLYTHVNALPDAPVRLDDGNLAPRFPICLSTFNWGNIDRFSFESKRLTRMKQTTERHCFSTLTHNLGGCGCCCNDGRGSRRVLKQAVPEFPGGARSFE